MATSKTQYNSNQQQQQQKVWSVLFAKQTNTNEFSMDESALTRIPARMRQQYFFKIKRKIYKPEAY